MQDSYWEEYLPMALECGMSPTQFWNGEPRLLNSYIRKHKLELDEFNYKSWLLNLYTYDAVSVSIAQVFGDKKAKYFDKPIEELYANNKTISKEEKEKTIQNTYRNQVNFWAKFGRKEVKNNG